MAEEKSILLEFLGDTPFFRVVDFLIENYVFDYTKKDIADNVGISRVTLYKIWSQLEKFKIIKESRKIGNTILYKLNNESHAVKQLMELDFSLSKEYADSLEKTPHPS